MILGYWLVDKDGNPIEQQDDANNKDIKDDDDEIVINSDIDDQDFITEKYEISDLFSK